MAKVNTVGDTVTHKENIETKRNSEQKRLLAYYKSEELVPVSVSPLYEPYLGKVMQVQINGITIAVPINGSTHKVPASFADVINERVMAVNNTIFKAKQMSDVRKNSEQYPGELKMF